MEGKNEAEIPRILYHGTTLKWAKRIRDLLGHYKTLNEEGTHLVDTACGGMFFARERASAFRDYPIMLVINTERCDCPVRKHSYENEYVVDRLNMDAFLVYDPVSPNGMAFNMNPHSLIDDIAIENLEYSVTKYSRDLIPGHSSSLYRL